LKRSGFSTNIVVGETEGARIWMKGGNRKVLRKKSDVNVRKRGGGSGSKGQRIIRQWETHQKKKNLSKQKEIDESDAGRQKRIVLIRSKKRRELNREKGRNLWGSHIREVEPHADTYYVRAKKNKELTKEKKTGRTSLLEVLGPERTPMGAFRPAGGHPHQRGRKKPLSLQKRGGACRWGIQSNEMRTTVLPQQKRATRGGRTEGLSSVQRQAERRSHQGQKKEMEQRERGRGFEQGGKARVAAGEEGGLGLTERKDT